MGKKSLTRKQYNHAVAEAARKAGQYALVMSNWASLDRSLTPAKAVSALLVSLEGSEPAKKPVQKAARKGACTVPVAQKADSTPVVSLDERVRTHKLSLTPLKIRAAIEAGLDAEASEGSWTIAVKVDGRFKPAKALKAAGFEIRNGKAVIHVHDGKTVADAVVHSLAGLFLDAGAWMSGEGSITGIAATPFKASKSA